jgi:hypothetical protein
MGQRPLFHAERNKLVDIPCSSHLEPCVIDTGKSRDLKLDPIRQRNTTDYTPTEASCALVAFEENNIGVVFTSVRETNMDVCYTRCTVATPFYICTTYFRITRCNNSDNDDKDIRLSCYTGCSEQNAYSKQDNEIDGRYEFRHCSVRLYVQTADSKDYSGNFVKVEKRIGVEKRAKSKSNYMKNELQNISLLFKPFGHRLSSAALPGSITIVYRPKSLEIQKISPRITVLEQEQYRVQIDSRYVLFCDMRQCLIILLDIIEKRVCIAPIRSKIQENELDLASLLEKASIIIVQEVSGTLQLESVINDRIYAFVIDEVPRLDRGSD